MLYSTCFVCLSEGKQLCWVNFQYDDRKTKWIICWLSLWISIIIFTMLKITKCIWLKLFIKLFNDLLFNFVLLICYTVYTSLFFGQIASVQLVEKQFQSLWDESFVMSWAIRVRCIVTGRLKAKTYAFCNMKLSSVICSK